MELQVPYSFCAKIQEKSVFRRKTFRDKRDTSKVMPMERGRNNRGRSMSRPYTYVGKHPAQDERFGLHGIPERQKCIADFSKMGKHEICIPKPRVLVQGILRGYRGQNTKAIKEYIADQLKQDKESDQIAMFDPRDPFMGGK